MTAAQVIAGLRMRHAFPEWVFLTEVRDATGARACRSADAIAMSCWPSRGVELHGFEVKVSRGDWTRERADPAKAEVIASRCHRWWIAAPAGMIVPDEVPALWGLVELHDGGTMRVKRDAALREPPPLDPLFVASMMRRAIEYGRSEEPEVIAQARAQALEEGKRAGREQGKRDGVVAVAELERLRASVSRFERETGIDIAHHGILVGRDFVEWRAAKRSADEYHAILRQAQNALRHLSERIQALRDSIPPDQD